MTLAVLFESHVVADVPVPFPVTATAMYFFLKVRVNLRVDFVALEIFLHAFGTEAVADFTCAVQEYHW